MDGQLSVLLTNDDGYDAPGIIALYEGLSNIADVEIVAPVTDQSAVGRTLSTEVDIMEIAGGYAIDGTPSDCIIVGIEGLGLDPDIVVAGCNNGANLGSYVLGRSGTISAAIEATFFDIPSIAVSLYIPEDEWPRDTDLDDYREAVKATRYLVSTGAVEDVFGDANYLNVNVPTPTPGPTPMELTRPSPIYNMGISQDGGSMRLIDENWSLMLDDATKDPPGTDRYAIANGRISVSPLAHSMTIDGHPTLHTVIEGYVDETADPEGSVGHSD